MEKNREYFKSLLAENALDILYDELFALLAWHKTQHQNRLVTEKYDDLVLLSGKLNSVQQSHQLGRISVEEFNTEVSRTNFALLDLLNDLPDAFFQQAQRMDTEVVTGIKKQYNIPVSIGNGLFWMGAVLILLIALGSLVQNNWITFVFTMLAALICLPPTFDYCMDKLHISVSSSIRVLLIIVITSVGLSFAPKTEPEPATHLQPKTQ